MLFPVIQQSEEFQVGMDIVYTYLCVRAHMRENKLSNPPAEADTEIGA